MKQQSTTPQASNGLLNDAAASEQTTLASTDVSVTISAWMDGDTQTSLPSELFTASGHATWQVYHLIGDTLRTPDLALSTQASLSQRVAQALAAEPALQPTAFASAVGERTSLTEIGAAASDTLETDATQTVTALRAAERSPLAPAPKLTPFSKLLRRVVWPSVAMAAAVASVVWVAKPLFVPELSAPSAQTANTTVQSPVVTNLEASAVRDYVTAHRQMSGPSNVRPASFGAAR
jgi:sigma-E factor negative regulatory protein RseA